MKKILLIYAPFCTPASPPFSIINLYSFLKNNYNGKINVLDLNLEFHKIKFPDYQKYFQKKEWNNYNTITNEFHTITSKIYSENNKKIVENKEPELIDDLINLIIKEKPDIIAFSIVYSSQAFYTQSILKKIKEINPKIITIIGGPAINNKLKADKILNNELELLNFLHKENNLDYSEKDLNFNYSNDYSIFNLKEYFTPNIVIPIKTTTSCYYQQCTFCSHHGNKKYIEYDLNLIKKNIINSKEKYFFIIDDMLHVKRIVEFANLIKDLKIKWACQLKPTKNFTYEVFVKLKESGLNLILWGVESGSNRILKLMKKQTDIEEIKQVLENSKKAGIKNVAYIMFGFPTETKEEFLDTINFLKDNEKNIDLISTTVFGLQKNTPIYNNPNNFGIKKIIEEERTVLEPKISYEVEEGLNREEILKLKEKYKKTILKINKYPKEMNFFREHMICLD
jgi:anaerobic magnesium-protoporphyrin IX monomethyl ester cyclase